jgi:5-methylcytosine-specific restriction endonuclease McrA
MENKNTLRAKNKTARKGKERPSGQWIRTDKRLAIYLRDEFRCVYCGADLHGAAPQDLTLDHVHPYSLGGENEAANLVTACRRCNCSRGARTLAAYADDHTRAAVRRQTARKIDKHLALAREILAGRGGETSC